MKFFNDYRKSFGVKLFLIQNLLLLTKKLPFVYKFYLKLCKYKNKSIQVWLETQFEQIIAKYKKMNIDLGRGNIACDCPIYVYWDMGLENAPDIVKLCCRQLEKYKGDHSVVYLDYSNLHQYVELPEYIYEKYRNGKIGKAHFSDIIRFTLLSNSGGGYLVRCNCFFIK